jgi:hypothetical protein
MKLNPRLNQFKNILQLDWDVGCDGGGCRHIIIIVVVT